MRVLVIDNMWKPSRRLLLGAAAALTASRAEAVAGMGRTTGNAIGSSALQYIAFGDSITAFNVAYDPLGGYSARWAAQFPYSPLYFDAGVNGTLVTDCPYAAYIVNKIAYSNLPTFAGNLCSVFFGTNDRRGSQTPAQFMSSLNTVVSALQAAGAKVIVCTAMNSYPNAPITNSFGETITTMTWSYNANALIRSSGLQDGLADFEAIAAMNGNNYMNATDYYTLGNIHPNGVGQALLLGVFNTAANVLAATF